MLAVNTDTQMLETVKSSGVFAIGPILTNGFGSGGNPRIGREAAKNIPTDKQIALEDLKPLG